MGHDVDYYADFHSVSDSNEIFLMLNRVRTFLLGENNFDDDDSSHIELAEWFDLFLDRLCGWCDNEIAIYMVDQKFLDHCSDQKV